MVSFASCREELRLAGWYRLPAAVPEETLREIERECEALERDFYRPEHLEAHRVYLSDRSETRISHAMMVSRGDAPLPTIPLKGRCPALARFLALYEELAESGLGERIRGSRSMLNWQTYLSGSKPVSEHFDGEYLRFRRTADGGFDLEEGLLPRYVLVLTLQNENHGAPEGTILRDLRTGESVAPPSRPGDLLIFDNLRFRHRVPALPRFRRMVGLRNFDAGAVHFVREPADRFPALEYQPIPEGWIAQGVDSVAIQADFLKSRWPAYWDELRRGGALF